MCTASYDMYVSILIKKLDLQKSNSDYSAKLADDTASQKTLLLLDGELMNYVVSMKQGVL